MRRSSQRDFAVYEFKEDDEAIESASGRFTSRFGKRGSPRGEAQAISQFTFLKAFAEDLTGEQSLTFCVDVDTSGCDYTYDCCVLCHTQLHSNFFYGRADMMDEISLSLKSYNMYELTSCDVAEVTTTAPECITEDSTRMELSSPATPYSADDLSNCALSDKPSNETQASVGSDDGGSWVSSPDHTDNEELKDVDKSGFFMGFDKPVGEDIDVPIIVLAEYVICGSKIYAESQLIFLSDSIKIQCSDSSGNNFTSEWGIADIDHINCQWSQSTPGLAVALRVRHAVFCCVPDFHWLEKEQKIMLLAPGYKNIWSTASDVKFSEEEEEGLQSNISRHYLDDFKESCDGVIYPKGDPDAVSISKRDVDLLQPETFINDTIIDFYIKYLINKIQPKEKHRFHFFNSFFFRKLVDLDKDPLSTAEGRAAFLRVRKWTRKVNIFEKDYLFIPVNYNLHWSLLVICHPGEVAHLKGKIPCILHMDSMKGNHDGLKKLIQSYLCEEWKERYSGSLEDTFLLPNFSNLRFIPLELPQQQNAFDCGFFLLHYVELFLKEAPANFNPFSITKFSNFLTADWFVPDEASHKRFVVRNLIFELLSEFEKESSPTSCSRGWPEDPPPDKEPPEFLAAMDDDTHEPPPLHHFFSPESPGNLSPDRGRPLKILLPSSSSPIRPSMSPTEEEAEPSGQAWLCDGGRAPAESTSEGSGASGSPRGASAAWESGPCGGSGESLEACVVEDSLEEGDDDDDDDDDGTASGGGMGCAGAEGEELEGGMAGEDGEGRCANPPVQPHKRQKVMHEGT
ncbi:unnamed protein product [Spirodela intermedia]|uniref:Ubiquitin-like protease family profile domain-containing protein n=1 Tax=Spirodela intermedia TaxID=51605 RepID=A0A7I8KT12_SPIIN|nr:unnamed protein product [Spirodela intermedia]